MNCWAEWSGEYFRDECDAGVAGVRKAAGTASSCLYYCGPYLLYIREREE